MVVPLTGVVDTVWVGRMGDALALAAQGAANQLFNAVSYAVSFVPTVTVPLVAAAYARGDLTAARARTCESLWLSCTIGLVGTMILDGAPRTALLLILPADALTMPLAASYLWLRSLSMVPALAASVAFAAFRGCLDVVTPLKVTLVSNLVNLVLDPIFIFNANMGVAGAAIATVRSGGHRGGALSVAAAAQEAGLVGVAAACSTSLCHSTAPRRLLVRLRA